MQPYSYTQYQPGGQIPQQPPVGLQTTPVRRFETTNHSAMVLSASGLLITFFTWLPVGLITGPMALARVREYERGRQEGRFDPTDEGFFNLARVMAWVSIAFSLPAVLFGLFVVVMLALA